MNVMMMADGHGGASCPWVVQFSVYGFCSIRMMSVCCSVSYERNNTYHGLEAWALTAKPDQDDDDTPEASQSLVRVVREDQEV